jgi:hypothetical protein
MTIYGFTVEGTADIGFPLDMLRFDACWPRHQVDAEKIAELIGNQSRFGKRPARMRIMLTGHSMPSLERWRAFGWVATEVLVREPRQTNWRSVPTANDA